MLDTEIKVETKDAARILASGKCLIEAKGKLLKFPSTDADKTGVCVWSGLITQMSGRKGMRGVETTHITCLDGTWLETSLSLDESMKLVTEA